MWHEQYVLMNLCTRLFTWRASQEVRNYCSVESRSAEGNRRQLKKHKKFVHVKLIHQWFASNLLESIKNCRIITSAHKRYYIW